MAGPITKRICELKPSDDFRWQATRVRVQKIENGRLYFRYLDVTGRDRIYRKYESLGANSKQLVEYLTNKKIHIH